MLPAILSLGGETLSADERALFRDIDPAGYILFARNCRDRGQLRRLTDSLRALSGRGDLPILIDQEGGRVARLGPPEWPEFPAAWRFAELYAKAPISAIEAGDPIYVINDTCCDFEECLAECPENAIVCIGEVGIRLIVEIFMGGDQGQLATTGARTPSLSTSTMRALRTPTH